MERRQIDLGLSEILDVVRKHGGSKKFDRRGGQRAWPRPAKEGGSPALWSARPVPSFEANQPQPWPQTAVTCVPSSSARRSHRPWQERDRQSPDRTDPDRLKEEQARGITIDLGFAHLAAGDVTWRSSTVGHERFVRNMLAGAAASTRCCSSSPPTSRSSRRRANISRFAGCRDRARRHRAEQVGSGRRRHAGDRGARGARSRCGQFSRGRADASGIGADGRGAGRARVRAGRARWRAAATSARRRRPTSGRSRSASRVRRGRHGHPRVGRAARDAEPICCRRADAFGFGVQVHNQSVDARARRARRRESRRIDAHDLSRRHARDA